MQIDELRRLAEQRGWDIVGEYVDHGVSGAKDRRPELDRLMEHVHRGRVQIVACYRFDRFARSVKHLVTALDEFRVRNIDFVSIHDGIDTSTPTGRFSFHIIAAVAELSREITRERVKSGLQAARRRGERLGRPPVRVDIGRVLAWRAEGLSYRAIARKLGGRVGVSTLHRAVKEARERGVSQTSVDETCEAPEIEEVA